MVRGDNSKIFSKAVLIIQITIVTHTSELHSTFSNQTNQQRCHVTKQNTWWHWKPLEKFCKHSSKCLTIKKTMKKDHLLASTKNLFPLCQNSAEDINLNIPIPLASFLFSLLIYFIFYVPFSHFKYFISLLVSTLFLSAFLSFIYSFISSYYLCY